MLALAGLAAAGAATAQPDSPLTREEALSLSAAFDLPPQRLRPDVSNRVSGAPAAIELGRRLFFDARLSPSGRVACSSCHRPERGWTDGRKVGVGLKPSKRNTPSLFDVGFRERLGHGRWFGWGGASDSLWMQSIRPLLDPAEMGSSARHVQAHIAGQADLASGYATAFGRAVVAVDEETALVDAAKALAAFQETITSPRTLLDTHVHSLSDRNAPAAADYPAAARRGLRWFMGAGQCVACHARTPNAGNRDMPQLLPRDASARADPGRRADIAKLLVSPYNLRGRFNDDPERSAHWNPGQFKPELLPPPGVFRPPTLRNLTRTAPYMHDGSKATLGDVLRSHGHPRAPLPDARQIADMVAFLRTLSVP